VRINPEMPTAMPIVAPGSSGGLLLVAALSGAILEGTTGENVLAVLDVNVPEAGELDVIRRSQ